MKTAVMAVLALGLAAAGLRANGGAYQYGTKSTGTLQPFQAEGVEQVAILEERLEIGLHRESAEVSVRYRMKSTGGKRVKVRFGFPVELVGERAVDAEESGGGPSAHERLAENLKDYRVWADGQAVAAEFRPEAGTREERAAFDLRIENIAGWMVSEIDFGKGQERVVQIGYRSRYEQAGSFVSDDAHHGPKVFKYRLSTGAVWEGPIRQGTVTVTATDVPADEVEIFKPVGKFKRDGSRWTWTFENLEPTLADDLEIRAVPARTFLGAYGSTEDDDGIDGYLEQAGVWSMMHRLYEAEASSTLAPDGKLSYDAAHVGHRDSDEDHRAWSEGVEGDGVGEWIELRPKRVLPLYALSIAPGYGKSERLFAANNRPSRVEILLNGEHRFEASLEDRDESQIVRVQGYLKPVKTVRITIREVYRGTHYRDTCISHVALLARLNKRPEVRGAR